MESSPLILAQTHARKAAKANTPTAAIDEHDQAAGQFAKAAKDTINSEALRTLKLLEQHHEKLAKIIKFRSAHLVSQPDSHPEAPTDVKGLSKNSPASVAQSPAKNSQQSDPQGSSPAHRPTRDVGSSIASNLASARGIPVNRQRRSGQASSPTVNQQNAEGKIVPPPRRSRLVEPPVRNPGNTNISEKPQTASRDTETSENLPTSLSKEAPTQAPAARADEPFSRFYSTFETLFSKLSAPLAFAGLPLTPDSEPASNSPAHEARALQPSAQRNKARTRATASPEYSRLFSPAAIRALREDLGTTALNPAESFYVVPTTGGTLPYASILARHSQQHQKTKPTLSRDDEDLSDEFVDARETPGNSPRAVRKTPSNMRSAGGKTLEELELENTGLRSTCDELSRRLWQFEVSSQMSQQALHQSIRAGLKGSPAASEAGASGTADVEARLKLLEKETTGMKKENERLKGVVGKYRERWERLKENAKTRREGTDKLVGAKDEEE